MKTGILNILAFALGVGLVSTWAKAQSHMLSQANHPHAGTRANP